MVPLCKAFTDSLSHPVPHEYKNGPILRGLSITWQNPKNTLNFYPLQYFGVNNEKAMSSSQGASAAPEPFSLVLGPSTTKFLDNSECSIMIHWGSRLVSSLSCK